MPTAQDLINVRSNLAIGAMEWLRGLADALDQTDWYFSGKRILASETAVDAFVYTKRRKKDDQSGPVRNAERAGSESSAVDESVAHLYEQPRDWEEREKKRWRQAIQQPRVRLGVRGTPGGGKTFLTRNSAVALARESAGRMERREISPYDAPVPFWLTAKALAATSASDAAETVVDAIQRSIKQINRRVPLPPDDWILKVAASPGALIFVDAVDELIAAEVEGFKQACRHLDDLPGRVIATCRTMHWEERAPWLGWRQIVNVELAPFERREQREFTSRFPSQTNSGGLAQVLAGNYPLRQACGSPLLLSFVCLLHAEGENLAGASRVTLYMAIVRHLLSGQWRNVTPPWKGNDVREEKVVKFLETAAWSIFREAPDANRFTLAKWEQVGPEPVNDLLFELVRCGLLVPAGFDDLGDRCWSFLHRTLLEFLAARWLARQPEEVWLAEAKKHFWYEPEWVEVLTFLAAHVKDATPLIQALEHEQEDILRSILSLKVRLAAVARRIDPVRLDMIASEVEALFKRKYCGLHGYEGELWEYCLAIAQMAGSPLGQKVAKALILLLRSENEGIRLSAAKALGRLGDVRAVEALAGLLRDEEARVRASAAKALGQLGDVRAVEALSGLLRDEESVALHDFHGDDAIFQPNTDVRVSAAMALAQLGDTGSVEALAGLLRDGSFYVRRCAADALGGLGDAHAVELLIGLLLRDEDILIRGTYAARLLGELGDTGSVEALAGLLRDETPYVRQCAAWALGELGGTRAIEALTGLLRDETPHVRQCAARALGELGDTGSVEALAGLLRDEEADVRVSAAEALAHLGDARAVEALAGLLRDEEADVRVSAAEALAHLGDARASEVLATLLWAEDVDVRRSAARALGRSGNARSVKALAELLRDWDTSCNEPSDTVLVAAAQALGELGDARGFGELSRLLKSADSKTKQDAARALGELGDARAIEALAGLLRDEYSWVVGSAIKALRKLIALDRTIRLPRP